MRPGGLHFFCTGGILRESKDQETPLAERSGISPTNRSLSSSSVRTEAWQRATLGKKQPLPEFSQALPVSKLPHRRTINKHHALKRSERGKPEKSSTCDFSIFFGHLGPPSLSSPQPWLPDESQRAAQVCPNVYPPPPFDRFHCRPTWNAYACRLASPREAEQQPEK